MANSAEEVYNGITSGGSGDEPGGCLFTLIAIVVFAAILFAFKEFGASSVFKVVGGFFTISALITSFMFIVIGINEVFKK
jgi:hypothetical protein